MVARYYFLPLALQLFRVNVTVFRVKRYNFGIIRLLAEK